MLFIFYYGKQISLLKLNNFILPGIRATSQHQKYYLAHHKSLIKWDFIIYLIKAYEK